ncbi:retropepsin-like aspartic protease family protein [Chromatocurvus halotolerans]|uniref:Aspartyl protease family protein n=2 Tax=Chromatocurvus halotolerans TaxID=1132028 RepID=A0A4R2KUQ0_9GAMM|nr:TIGR02281 family clan AA aspartic protease [Chromatocurvus halotolerans]TCO70445.1 aspartyl protease family protein [Chromatocurvus halotolerans]
MLLFLCAAAGPGQNAVAQAQVSVEALMPGMVVLTIDGKRHTLRRGASAAGVTLIDATAEEALLEIAGEQRSLGVSDRVSAAFTEPGVRQIDIPRNDRMQYQTTALINGRRTDVLVDTGANIVAMNAAQAQRLGIPPGAGQATRVETAGNTLVGRSVNLDFVDVGGIRVDNVRATVLEGDYPRMILLGMTYLEHVSLQERNGILSLSRDW